MLYLPEKTAQTLYQSAWGCVRAARDSSLCRGRLNQVRGELQISKGAGCRVDDSRLRGVHGRGQVTDVLRALEHPEGQAGQEVSG